MYSTIQVKLVFFTCVYWLKFAQETGYEEKEEGGGIDRWEGETPKVE